MNLIDVVERTLSHVQFYLHQLDPERYTRSLEVLSYSSIGQHTRHIIEFFECLQNQCNGGTVNYDLRQRNLRIETEPLFALDTIQLLLARLADQDLNQAFLLQHGYDTDSDVVVTVETTFSRELVYNIEHTIHHLAMIKIGLKIMDPGMKLPKSFGVAPSTVRYQLASK